MSITILDSTLREGEQSPGVLFKATQREHLAWELDKFGVDQIEISPIISKAHEKSLKNIIQMGLSADIISHGRALKQDIDISLRCDATWCAAYLGISKTHLNDKLRITKEKAKEIAVSTVEYAKQHGLKIRFTLEDACRADLDFVCEMTTLLEKAGVDRISLPDTVGVMIHDEMYDFFKYITLKTETKIPLDVHAHNDLGLALANSLSAIEGGASQIHTTINGIGERTGIPSLAEVSTILSRVYGNKYQLEQLSDLSRSLEQCGMTTAPDKPLVGANAYKHKAGTHLSAISRNPESYEAIPPETVGNTRSIVISGLSGKAGARLFLQNMGLNPTDDDCDKLTMNLKKKNRNITEMPFNTDDLAI